MKKLYIIAFLVTSIFACTDVINEIPDRPFGTTAYEFTFDRSKLPPVNIPEDNALTNEGVFLGRMLFYDPILSADSTISCASCHKQEYGFADNAAFSKGINNQLGTRSSMTVFNLTFHLNGFFWDNRTEILRHQVLEPIQDPTEMNETLGNIMAKLSASPRYKEHFKKAFNSEVIDEELTSKAIEQFLISIISADSKFDTQALTAQEERGRETFFTEATPLKDEQDPDNPQNIGADCFHCHGNSNFMSKESFTNGLPSNGDLGLGGFTEDPKDNFKFKTPTLRNIEVTAPYMHDGRFSTLEEVVDFYLGPMDNAPTDLSDSPNLHTLKDSIYLSTARKAALVSFLKTLTDDELINDERYSDPFN